MCLMLFESLYRLNVLLLYFLLFSLPLRAMRNSLSMRVMGLAKVAFSSFQFL